MEIDEIDWMTALDKLLISIKSEGWKYIIDKADNSLIVIDNAGDPHKCWNASDNETINVCVPMTIDDAIKYFKNPSALSFIEKDTEYDKSYGYNQKLFDKMTDKVIGRAIADHVFELRKTNEELEKTLKDYQHCIQTMIKDTDKNA